MSNKSTHTKITGGGGFEFEDKVAAYFMCCLLSSRSPLNPNFGTISQIDFQVSVDGWLFDDILITLKYASIVRRCAFSIKSNVQFTKTTAPSKFVEIAWEQFLNKNKTLFNNEIDKLGIITSPLYPKTKTWLNDLINKARCQESHELAKKILQKQGYVSKEERKLFKSFTCPKHLADKHSVSETNIGELLKCLEHLQFDFEDPASSKYSEAIAILRSVIRSDSQEEAISLWESLCYIAKCLNTNGGYIDYSILIDRLRPKFELKDNPDHTSLWEEIKQKTIEELILIPSKIANKITIYRPKVISTIKIALETNNIVVLIGASGCGKTVIKKTIIESFIESNKVIWINAENIFRIDEISNLEIFKVIPDKSAYLILDGLDRFFEDSQFKKIALILKSCLEGTENNPWKIILSCQPEEWSRVQYQLSYFNINATAWMIIKIENPSFDDLEPVWKNYPSLIKLSCHTHLTQFLYKPKVLDLFAARLHLGGSIDTQKWIGESNLIEWYWEQEINKHADNLKRGILLKKIAEKMANELTNELPASDFTFEELDVIKELKNDRILRIRNEKILFEHDLIAEWTRLRLLIENCSNVSEYLSNKLTSPLWCRALRLLGLHFLETEPDIKQWKNIFDSFSEKEDLPHLGRDLLIEAAIFSADPLNILEKMWDILKENDGLLLRRLLNRFLYDATFPNELILLMASKYDKESISEVTGHYKFRDPLWPYWIPVIEFLYKHKSDVIKFAKKQIVVIVDKWLRYSQKDWPMRKEAAEIAIEFAEDMLAFKMSEGTNIVRDDIDKLAFRAGLAACNEQVERTINLALTACSRKNPSDRILKEINKNNETLRVYKEKIKHSKPELKIPNGLFTPLLESELPHPWTEGPRERVDSTFQEICLDTDALYPVIITNPDIAKEIILALLIEHPVPRDRYYSSRERYTGLASVHNWFPPFYTRGPFLFFLNTHPDKALELVISLINFSTERWAEKWTEQGQEPPCIQFEFPWGSKKFVGDAYVYYWHRDVGKVSHIIPTVLMALEKWFYDRIEKEKFKDKVLEFIDKILKNSSSLAFIGLLISIGKKNPELFCDKLLHLLSIPELYSWDVDHRNLNEMHQMMGWFGLGIEMQKLAEEFNSMPHRKYQLSEKAINIFLNKKSLRSSFEQFRRNWKERFDKGMFDTVSPYTLENLIQWFDISNWKQKKDQEHGEDLFFEMPKEIVENRKVGLKENQERQLLVHLPLYFRQVLNRDQKITNDDGKIVWETIQKVSEIKLSEDDPDYDELQKENAICGAIAVLFKNYKDWLKQESDKWKWCIEKITNIILYPPKFAAFEDNEINTCNYSWDCFCAEIIPIIWADDPKNYLYRRCIAVLAVNIHYETVKTLFASASELRESLGKNFNQIQNFLIRWAHVRWKCNRERYNEKKSFDVKKWLDKEVASFEKEAISTELPILDIVAKEEIEKRNKLIKDEMKKRGRGWHPPKEIFFDLWLIKAAFNWMPALDQAINRNEREEWLKFWKQVLTWTLNILEKNEDGKISGTPTEWDRWVLEKIAYQILSMEDNEKPEEFWIPILDLGHEGHYWVEDFLIEWFRKGIRNEKLSDNFIKCWEQMLEYAFKSDKWKPSKDQRRYYLDQIWCDLLGMNYYISSLWKENKKSILRKMRKYYERWATIFLKSSRNATLFIKFLQLPASIELLVDGLVWLERASNETGEKFFNMRDNLPDILANLLEISWRKHKEKIVSNIDTFNSFKSLLKKLVDVQNPQAMEIHQTLIS